MIRSFITLLLALSMYASGAAMDASISYATFYSPSGNYVEVYLQVFGKTVEFVALPSGEKQARVEVVLIFSSADTVVKFDKYVLFSPASAEVIDFVDTKRYNLENGAYRLDVSVADVNREANAANYTTAFNMDYGYERFGVSDIQLLASLRKMADDAPLNSMVKNGYLFEPLASHFYDRNASSLVFYAEIYQPVKQFGEDFLLIWTISEVSESGDPIPWKIGYRRCSPEDILPVLQQIDISKLKSGNYSIDVEIADRKKQVFAKKYILFQRSNPFFQADRESIAEGEFSLDEEFAGKLSDDELRYSLKAIAMLVDKNDGELLNLLLKEQKPEAMRLYLFSFWANEDNSDPQLAYESYMKVARAVDERFRGGFGYGFETDRGYIFLKYGAPNDVVTVEDEPSAPPYEIWSYNQFEATGQSNVKFLFYNPSLAMNGYTLLHATARGEINNPRWEIELYKSAPTEAANADYFGGTTMQDNIGRRARQLMADY